MHQTICFYSSFFGGGYSIEVFLWLFGEIFLNGNKGKKKLATLAGIQSLLTLNLIP